MSVVVDLLPLAPLAQGMAFESIRAEQARPYFQQMLMTLDGVDPLRLRRAVEETLGAHPNLFIAVEHEDLEAPIGVAMSGVSLPWTEQDWRGLTAAAFADRLSSHLAADRARGFDLTRAPLLRALLVRESDQRWRFCLAYHHLLMDGWSAALLFDELAERYRALVAGEAPQLPERRPYADFLAWLADRDGAQAEAWWRRHLADAPVTALPMAPRSAPRRTAELRMTLAADEWKRLRAACRDLGVTPATAAAGAWALVLARAHGEPDIVFGATLSGRPDTLAGAEAMIGLFINTVPIRVRPREALPLGVFLTRLQASIGEAREHGHVPLARIQGWAGPTRAAFETLFVYENYPAAAAATASVLGVAEAINHEESNYPGALILEPGENGLGVSFFYDAGRMAEEDAALLIGRYVRLLQAIAAAEPRARLCDLSHLTPRDAAAAQALRAAAAPGDPSLLPDLFLAAAQANPQAPALVSGYETVSYAKLRDRALAMAAALAERGIGPGKVVGIAMPRGTARYAALFGVFLSGAAAFVVDLDQPEARIAQAELSVRPDLVIVGGAEVPGSDPARHLRFDTVAAASPATACKRPALDDIAYVILTSGSTGTPKPVGVSYRAIGHFVALDRHRDQAERILVHMMQLHFDATFVELAQTLLSGGTLVLPAAGEDFQQAMEASGATAIATTPSILALLDPGRLPRLRHVTVGGEALPAELAERWTRHCALRNAYGPTEATVYATNAELRPGDPVTIGRPLPYVSAYVLSPTLRPAAIGELGELYLAGPGLALGYLGMPGPTARVFLPDPFGAPGARMYRTGDRVRLTCEGRIAFAGRRDGQVKLRGLRVELEEIETAIFAATGLGPHEAAAALVPGPDGRPRLVACVTRDLDAEPFAAALAPRLPAALRPQAVVRVATMPLTPTGKLDRTRLAVLAAAAGAFGAAGDGRYATETEEKVAVALAQALGIDRVAPDDDFFALGGDSIVSLQAATAGRRKGLALTPTTIIALRTPRAIAAELDVQRPDRGASALVTLEDGAGLPIVLVGGAGGGPEAMLAVARGLAGRRVLAFKPGERDTTIFALARGLVDVLTPADARRGAVIVGHSFGAYVALEAVRLLRARGLRANMIVLDAAAPLGDRRRPPVGDDANLHAALAAMAAEIMGRVAAQTPDRAAVLSLLIEAGIAHDAAGAERLVAESREHGMENARYVADALPLRAMLLVRASERADPPRAFEPPAGPGEDWGWARLTGGHVATAVARGNHISMLRGDAGAALGAMLRAYLEFELSDEEPQAEELSDAE